MTKIVIVGGGFAGFTLASELEGTNYEVTILDKRNYHLFQPLLYQVATANLAESSIITPLRAAFTKCKNVSVYMAEVTDFNIEQQSVQTNIGNFSYDQLVVCCGATSNYFGNVGWQRNTTGLKTVEDALVIRNKILYTLERAEVESSDIKRRNLLRFVIIGSGPTGVELAGALGELVHNTIDKNFCNFNSSDIEIILIEGSNRILQAYTKESSDSAQKQLEEFKVKVIKNARVIDIQSNLVKIRIRKDKDLSDKSIEDVELYEEQSITSGLILWTAGMRPTTLINRVASLTNSKQDQSGRIFTESDLSLLSHNNIFLMGDVAHVKDSNNQPLPATAAVAVQQGKYLAKTFKMKAKGKSTKPFNYRNMGNMAIIGKNSAVAEFNKFKVSGYFAWLIWGIVHIWYLIGYDNKLVVMIRWITDYFTAKRSNRMIVNDYDDLCNKSRLITKNNH